MKKVLFLFFGLFQANGLFSSTKTIEEESEPVKEEEIQVETKIDS